MKIRLRVIHKKRKREKKREEKRREEEKEEEKKRKKRSRSKVWNAMVLYGSLVVLYGIC